MNAPASPSALAASSGQTPRPAIRPIRVTNSMSGKKELLETHQPGKLTLYSCGPTVYGFIHIGNLRSALVADLFFRYFKRVGYDVNYVRNYTDVDDKIIDKGKDEGLSADEVAKKYTQEVERDFAVAGLEEPTHKAKVTEHLPEIIEVISKIIANGKAYVARDGEVLFSIKDFEGYGKLSKKNLEDLVAGIRVEVSDKKRNPLDFTLWKPAKPGEPKWSSPWCEGRPGWHIECSAMASKWLGEQIDVHHGGPDLIFPHHENEIAQSEAASGRAPFVKYWLHHAFLTISKEKMSKSIGNVFTAREFLTRFGGELARCMLLGVHYRSPIDFSEETIEQTLTYLQRIYEAKKLALELSKKAYGATDPRAEVLWGTFLAECQATRQEMDDAYANDFNTAGALASVFTLIRSFNRTLAEPLAQATPGAAQGAAELVRILEEDLGTVIGIGKLSPEKGLSDLERIRSERAASEGQARPTPEEIAGWIQARTAARAAKNFAESDRIRKELETRGVLIKDGPQGTTWEYR